MSVELLLYPTSTFSPFQLPDIFIELQNKYVGYLFLFGGEGKNYLEYLSYGLTPKLGFIFKKPNTINDYLIIVSDFSIHNPRNYQSGDDSGSGSMRFVEIFNLLEYLAKVESDGEKKVVNPIACFDKDSLREDYENDPDILSKFFNYHLLNMLPAYLLNPAWTQSKILFDSANQIGEIMFVETNIHSQLGVGCYGLPEELNSQKFSVWETGEDKPSNLTFLEMARKLRIFLDRVKYNQNKNHLKGMDNVYSALNFCSSHGHPDEKLTMKTALIISDNQDHCRIEIIPAGWDNNRYVQRLPNTKYFDYNGIKNDGSVFKLFKY